MKIERKIQPSPTLVINERTLKLEKEGKKVFRFGFGQSPFPVPDLLVDRLKQHAQRKEYLPVQGLLPLRDQIAFKYSKILDVTIKANQIVIGPGTKELIWSTIFLFPGEIILPAPSWVSYAPQATLANKKIIWLPASEKNNWIITPEDFERAIQSSSAQKLVVLNYPNNPTGSIPTEAEMKDIIDVARKYNVVILHDNIYGRLNHSKSDSLFYKHYPEGTIFSDGLSKWCGAGGWRLGFHIFPKQLSDLKTAIIAMASETYSCVSTPIQYAAAAAFEHHEEIDIYQQKTNAILKIISRITLNQLQEMNLVTQPSEGGFYFFPIFREYQKGFLTMGLKTSVEICEHILQNSGVALLPGSAFGRPLNELSARLAYVNFDGDAVLKEPVDKINSMTDEQFMSLYCPDIIRGLLNLKKYLSKINC